jgi:hypothetical protein
MSDKKSLLCQMIIPLASQSTQGSGKESIFLISPLNDLSICFTYFLVVIMLNTECTIVKTKTNAKPIKEMSAPLLSINNIPIPENKNNNADKNPIGF